MSENFPERSIGSGELADIVYGPLDEKTESTMLLDMYQSYESDYQAAVNGGDPRRIEEAEQRLSGLVETYPELRHK